MIVVSNSTPLMHFAKVGKLELLKSAYSELIISSAAFEETVSEGILLGEEDAFLIEKEVGKWIKVLASQDDATVFSTKYKIHEGEAASILLAMQLDADFLLINEKDGRAAAKASGVKVKGTIGVISDCIKNQIIKSAEAIEILLKFKKNPLEYWINPDIIDMAIEKF
ncbi:MAG: hypothetical protein K8R34_18765 [Methanosarcinales archaeon]|nr:hypothetical protein [Methanosarcinales archaeon]